MRNVVSVSCHFSIKNGHTTTEAEWLLHSICSHKVQVDMVESDLVSKACSLQRAQHSVMWQLR